MKFTSFIPLAGLAASALAAPAVEAPTQTLEKRADTCDQWGSITTGTYTVYQDLWNEGTATSGSQCSGVDSLSGTTIAWHTKWTWAGASNQVKSYANAGLTMTSKQLSAISSIPTTWKWTYTGSNIVADVAYDLFTTKTSSTSETAEYEIMIWLAALGGAGPISATGSAIASNVKIGSNTFNLFYGSNGIQNVYSFVATSTVNSYSGDLKAFFTYLINNQGFSSSVYLKSVQAGTEPFTGSNAVFTTSAYSVKLS